MFTASDLERLTSGSMIITVTIPGRREASHIKMGQAIRVMNSHGQQVVAHLGISHRQHNRVHVHGA